MCDDHVYTGAEIAGMVAAEWISIDGPRDALGRRQTSASKDIDVALTAAPSSAWDD